MVTSLHQGSARLAGLAARLSPLLLRQQAEDQRILVEDADMEKIMSRGLGPHDVLDDKHEVHLQAPVVIIPFLALPSKDRLPGNCEVHIPRLCRQDSVACLLLACSRTPQ